MNADPFTRLPGVVAIAALLLIVGAGGCGNTDADIEDDVGYFTGTPQPVDPDCTSARLTAYEAGDGGWCEFSSSLSALPAFVRSGMHLAIAEPWNGGSHNGDIGEACGECWEINTVTDTVVVMVNNLCPIEGNPLCSGGHFHFDLSQEAAAALGGGGLDEGVARRISCPVEGTVHVQVNDANEWGYLRFALINHRIAVRSVEVSASPDGPWISAERSGGAMHVLDGPRPTDGEGVWFRLRSATGQQITATLSVPFLPPQGTAHDLGVQFADSDPSTGECRFIPPPVYADGFGGIEGVKWQPNPWGDTAVVSEVTSSCSEGAASCLRVILGPWEGVHLYYRQAFPLSLVSGLSLRIRGLNDGELTVAPSNDGERCIESPIRLSQTEWETLDISLTAACTGFATLNGLTIANGASRSEFLIDTVYFYADPDK